ncbi:MAG: class I SAM-dependent methyltransferase [Chloroflexi bacterium]|nr:class I SAM-dependent methyltransferase [Chloroflexota bacterium]
MYEVMEISLADTRRLYQYKQSCTAEIAFNLKGFEYGWLESSRNWSPQDKILDVGGAYSTFPIHLNRTYRCETWVVDDFGLGSGEKYWARDADPHEHIRKHPEVKYVLERVGDPQASSLPQGYFDVVYSASALEHVPAGLTPAVWRHMAALLKPGGELIHAVDIHFPSNGGMRKIAMAVLFDAFPALAPANLRSSHYLATPSNYARLAFNALEIRSLDRSRLGIVNMVLNPEVLSENYDIGYNRIARDGMKDYRFQRVGALLIHLKKI